VSASAEGGCWDGNPLGGSCDVWRVGYVTLGSGKGVDGVRMVAKEDRNSVLCREVGLAVRAMLAQSKNGNRTLERELWSVDCRIDGQFGKRRGLGLESIAQMHCRVAAGRAVGLVIAMEVHSWNCAVQGTVET
jgi:hypothetical protein